MPGLWIETDNCWMVFPLDNRPGSASAEAPAGLAALLERLRPHRGAFLLTPSATRNPVLLAGSESGAFVNGNALPPFGGWFDDVADRYREDNERTFRLLAIFMPTVKLVGNLTTDIDGADTGGVRWFELRRTGGVTAPWQLYQEGTVALGDFVDRWMGAIAVDQNGNIGLGYSAVRDSSHAVPNNTGVLNPAITCSPSNRTPAPASISTSSSQARSESGKFSPGTAFQRRRVWRPSVRSCQPASLVNSVSSRCRPSSSASLPSRVNCCLLYTSPSPRDS